MTLSLLPNSNNCEITVACLVVVTNQYSKNTDSSLLINLALCLRKQDPESLTLSTPLSDLKTSSKIDYDVTPESSPSFADKWVSYALKSLISEPADVIDPIMPRLNEAWKERINTVELDLLNLKAEIHFASRVDDEKTDKNE